MISVCDNMLTNLLKENNNTDTVTKLNWQPQVIFLRFLRVPHLRIHNISRNMVNKGCHLMLSAFYSVFQTKHFPFDSIVQLNLSDLSHQNSDSHWNNSTKFWNIKSWLSYFIWDNFIILEFFCRVSQEEANTACWNLAFIQPISRYFVWKIEENTVKSLMTFTNCSTSYFLWTSRSKFKVRD